MEPKTFQDRAQNRSKSRRHATFLARGRSGRLKTRIRTSTQAKRGEDTTAYTHFDRKSCQHGAKWASKIEPKSIKNRCKNRLKNWCHSRLIFKSILVDFWSESGGTLHQNRIKNLRSQKMWKMHLELARYCKIGFGGSNSGAKIDRNWFKNEVNLGRHLGIDFW